MVDVETLGTAADSVIMSIGAVRFDLDSDKMDDAGFYRSISIESNLDYKRRVQEDTLIWWLGQSPAAQAVFHEPKETLQTALCEFSDWLGHQIIVDVPWKFWNSRCARTYKNLPQARNVSVPRIGTHHNALADAIYQAQLMQAIQREVTGKDKKVKA